MGQLIEIPGTKLNATAIGGYLDYYNQTGVIPYLGRVTDIDTIDGKVPYAEGQSLDRVYMCFYGSGSGLVIGYMGSTGYGAQLRFSHNGTAYFRKCTNHVWGSWKEVAFTE